MAIDAQRIRSRAARIREDRATRNGGPTTKPYDAERDGDVDEGADLGPSPVSDTEDRIARVEGVSTFRSVRDMGGLGDPGAAPFATPDDVSELGRELAEQVDSRVQDWLQEAREEFGTLEKTPREGFVTGAIFGALALALGVLLGGRTRFR